MTSCAFSGKYIIASTFDGLLSLFEIKKSSEPIKTVSMIDSEELNSNIVLVLTLVMVCQLV